MQYSPRILTLFSVAHVVYHALCQNAGNNAIRQVETGLPPISTTMEPPVAIECLSSCYHILPIWEDRGHCNAQKVRYNSPTIRMPSGCALDGLNKLEFVNIYEPPRGGLVDFTDQRLCRVKITFDYESDVLPEWERLAHSQWSIFGALF